MDIKALHEPFSDNDSPTVEGQIRWLQKQGFAQHQIQQALIAVYSEIERGDIPQVWTRKSKMPDGGVVESKLYLSKDMNCPGAHYKGRNITTGWELDQYLLTVAKRIRTDELSVMVKKMEEFEEGLRKKWAAQQKGPWYKRIVGK
jgi:hypothetical protein